MEDLTNQIIGNIKIICRDYDYGKNKGLKEWNKKTFWTCECLLCGSIFTRQGSIIKELGDNNKCNTCSKSKITFNKKYGMLTVLKRDNDYVKNHKIKNTRQKYYLCKCDCGKIVTKRADYLLQQDNPNCGCIKNKTIKETSQKRILSLVSKKFGLLKVISQDEVKSKPGQIFWNCQCDCGNYVSVCGKHLKNGNTISCGCISRSLGEQKIEEILQKILFIINANMY